MDPNVSNGNSILVSVIYVVLSVGLTVWLARILFRSGTAFLRDVFDDKPDLADALNRLLVVGFYMLSLGYALYILRASRNMDGFSSLQFLVNRLAILLVTLAALHFINVTVFWKIRGRREQRHLPMPVSSQAVVPQTPPTPATPVTPANEG
jgi:hypothetical protein